MKTGDPRWVRELSRVELEAFIPMEARSFIAGSQSRTKVQKGLRIIEQETMPIISFAEAAKGPKYRRLPAKRITGRQPMAGKKQPPKKRNIKEIVLKELHSFFCTRSSRYSSLRKELREKKDMLTGVIVGYIAAKISSIAGLVTAAVQPYVAFILVLLVIIGKEALCNYLQ